MAYKVGSSMPRIYDKFKGIDLLNPTNLVDTSRSPDCLNVWKSYAETDSNIIQTRPRVQPSSKFFRRNKTDKWNLFIFENKTNRA